MIIHKSHSKNDMIELINLLNLPIVFSHQDNKKMIHEKLISVLKTTFEIKSNYFKIETKQDLIDFLINKNPKKTLNVKEKNDVMLIAKHIINYCKNNYNIDTSVKYNTHKEIEDDLDYIRQFGDIPSVRRCCKLIKNDPNFVNIKFEAVISPQIQKELEQKIYTKLVHLNILKVRFNTPENPVVVYFD